MVASKRGPLKGVPFWRAIVPLPGFFSFVTCQVTVDRLGIRQYYHTFTTLQHRDFAVVYVFDFWVPWLCFLDPLSKTDSQDFSPQSQKGSLRAFIVGAHGRNDHVRQ